MAAIDWPDSVNDLLLSGTTIGRPYLTGWWSFNLVATPGADFSGLGKTATLSGTADAAGYSGRGRSFLNTTDYMTLPAES